ncbi:hypothetical protein [Foetidibacter luteolus]|uniref:hypothetical protein n=1 Tax=Foetidibacter luteolus TaxID=2608880 RepID=UPI00129ABF2C|nr:hypothetical protein [Foetidibacter luteolus]
MELNLKRSIDADILFAHLDFNNIDECLGVAKNQGVTNFILNPMFGWKEGGRIDFVERNPWIEGIQIVADDCDVSPLNYLRKLKYLSVPGNKYKGELDFKNFADLKHLFVYWNKKNYKGIENCEQIENLFMWRWPFKDVSMFSSMKNLNNLNLFFSSLEDLNGVEYLSAINKLKIYSAPKLSDISQLEKISSKITKIYFELCWNIKSYRSVEKMINLQSLYIYRCASLDCVKFIENFNQLEYAYIGVDVLDGDIEILKKKKIEYKKSTLYS